MIAYSSICTDGNVLLRSAQVSPRGMDPSGASKSPGAHGAGSARGPRVERVKRLPDVAFQNWVKTTFGVTIPATAAEIVPHPGHIDDDAPRDPFCRWVRKMAR